MHMKDRKKILNVVNDEDSVLVSNLLDKIELAEKTGKTIFSNEFYGPNIWSLICSLSSQFNINIHNNGIFEEAERRMLCFTQDESVEFPVILVKIQNKSNFHTLKHKDYLGAVMSLGIKREKFGDFVVDGDCCYIALCQDVKDYILFNLTNIGKCPCSIEFLEKLYDFKASHNFQTEIVNVSSMRIDCIAAALCNVSRNESESLIRQGKVLINYSIVSDKDETVRENSVITIRGFGKYKLIENIGLTSKGRNKIKIKKYI